MKAHIFSVLVLLTLIAGCNFLEEGFHRTKGRNDCFGRTEPPVQDGQKPPLPLPVQDTVLYYTAVCFDKAYDWRRDTAAGNVKYTLRFYKDHEPVQNISSDECESLSPDPYSHHIIDGQLYTERNRQGVCYLGRNGETLFSFEGREFMKGILPKGNDIYTLSQNHSGEGFTLRKNGEIVFSKSKGVIFGGLDDPSYPQSGALYSNGGEYCFCYSVSENSGTGYFCVEDGSEQEIGSLNKLILDLKLYGKFRFSAGSSLYTYSIEDARVWTSPLYRQMYLIGGRINNMSGIITPAGTISEICREEGTVLAGESRHYTVFEDANADYIVADSDGQRRKFSQMSAISSACVDIMGDILVLGLSARDADKPPLIAKGNEYRELDVHGYISRVQLELSPPM